MTPKRTLLSLATPAILLISGCLAPLENNIEERYFEKVREIGLVPVYPPREDLQVGDIYAYAIAESSNDNLRTYVSTIPEMRKGAEDFINTRVVFRESTTSGTTKKDMYGKELSTRGDEGIRVEALPITAFPTITAQEGSAYGLGLGAVLSAIGFGGSSTTYIKLDFVDVRSYWIPNIEVGEEYFHIAREKFWSRHINIKRELKSQFKENAAANKIQAEFCERNFGAVIVSRVYLTREIKYTYTNGRISAAGLKVSAEKGRSIGDVASPRVSVSVSTDSDGNVTQDGAASELEALRKSIDDLAKNGGTGAGLSFEDWTVEGLVFSKKFDRPVVIGWEGVDVPNIDFKNDLCPSKEKRK